MERLRTHASVSEALARLRDAEISALVAKGRPLHAGVGGRSALIAVGDTPIFVKQIPLTDLERRPEHLRSTANLFGIPLSCHYGLGGPGFNSWRELAAHERATGWVLSGACESFPLLYHWRVLPLDRPEELKGDFDFWLESAAVRARLEAIRGASAQLILFCEYVPENLLAWLGSRLGAGAETAEAAVAFVDLHLSPTIAFMGAHGLTHFDPHFENILTDGRRLYFGDFGLALSSDFELTEAEVEFLARHRRYDYGRAAVGYAHCISAACFGAGPWKDGLRKYLEAGKPSLPPRVAAAVLREAPRALAFLEFSRRLREESKLTPYPVDL